MADAFLTDIKNAGYITGIYTNKDFSDKYFESDLLYANNLWIAQYNQECTYNKPYMMWQYTETGTINDIGTSSNPAYFEFLIANIHATIPPSIIPIPANTLA